MERSTAVMNIIAALLHHAFEKFTFILAQRTFPPFVDRLGLRSSSVKDVKRSLNGPEAATKKRFDGKQH